MSATITYAEAEAKFPADVWKKFINHQNRWTVTVGGQEFPPGTDFTIKSPFGAVHSAVALKTDGTLDFDRPRYQETPFGQTIIWAKRKNGRIVIGFIVQPRPHADQPGEENHDKPNEIVKFMTCIMGFKDKARHGVVDAMKKVYESSSQAARREGAEEMGTANILSEWEHATGHNPSPSFTSTWGSATALQIDLSTFTPAGVEPTEEVLGRHWLTVRQWKNALALGYFKLKDGTKAYTAYDASSAVVAMFLASHPQYDR